MGLIVELWSVAWAGSVDGFNSHLRKQLRAAAARVAWSAEDDALSAVPPLLPEPNARERNFGDEDEGLPPSVVTAVPGLVVVMKPYMWDVSFQADRLGSTNVNEVRTAPDVNSCFLQELLDAASAPLLHFGPLRCAYVTRLDRPSSGLLLASPGLRAAHSAGWQSAEVEICRGYVVMLACRVA